MTTTLAAILLATGVSSCHAAEPVCINADDHRRISETYANLFSRYDLPTVAQAFLEANAAVQDVKERRDDCLRNPDDAHLRHCELLQQQYDVKLSERDAITRRFNSAIDLQEYLLTLKLKLERPRCE